VAGSDPPPWLRQASQQQPMEEEMKRKKLAVIPATVLAIGVLAVPAQGGPIKSCPTGDEPNPNWSTTQKGSCNSSHDPVTKNPGGNVPPGQQQ
jgi:hypothetical protein